MPFKFINPDSLGSPQGYSNGILTEGNRLLFVAGQIGCDANLQVVSDDIIEQFDRALANVISVVTEAGGTPQEIARMTIYVTDKAGYIEHRRAIGERYRSRLGKHFPAMTLVEVKSLLDARAKVEIEATAVLKVE